MKSCVGAVLVQGERVLLGKRTATANLAPSVWDIPGGHAEDGETLDATLRRELNEEIGVAPVKCQWLATVYAPDRDSAAYEIQIFLVVAWKEIPRNLCPREHDELGWFTVEDACCLPLAHPDYPALFRQAVTAARVTEPPR